jgi:hypothetical protein
MIVFYICILFLDAAIFFFAHISLIDINIKEINNKLFTRNLTPGRSYRLFFVTFCTVSTIPTGN